MAVYVIKSEPGPVKIGISVDPAGRLADLQTSSAVRLSLAHVLETDKAREVEARAHGILKAKRLRGEWFDVDVADAVHAVMQAARDVPPNLGEKPPDVSVSLLRAIEKLRCEQPDDVDAMAVCDYLEATIIQGCEECKRVKAAAVQRTLAWRKNRRISKQRVLT